MPSLHFTESAAEILRSEAVCFIICVRELEPLGPEWAIVHCRCCDTGHVEYRTTVSVAEEVVAQLYESDIRSFHSGFEVNLSGGVEATRVIVNFGAVYSHDRLLGIHALGFEYGMHVRLMHKEFQNSGGLKPHHRQKTT